MRAVVQRVLGASVETGGVVTGRIGPGLLVYLGVAAGDKEADSAWLAEKIANLRIFGDAEGLMNLSLLDKGGAVLAVSQFTLLADARKGRRPSYSDAAPPEAARPLYEAFVALIAAQGLAVEKGTFQAEMFVTSVNDGPVTILLDSRKAF
jgi:D-tyrosyl-tRNA(Tyr) deacylase